MSGEGHVNVVYIKIVMHIEASRSRRMPKNTLTKNCGKSNRWSSESGGCGGVL